MSVAEKPIAPLPWGLSFYRAVTSALGPVADIALDYRLKRGKEDERRLGERKGAPGVARPAGPLMWIHAVSVGESLSILPLIERLSELRPDLSFLVTTGTITSANLMEERLPPAGVHQFAPVDRLPYVRSFLDHWAPDCAIFMESEFWPNIILETSRRGVPMALLNARISPRSFDKWRRRPGAIRRLLNAFDVRIAQDGKNAERVWELGRAPVSMFGNLKMAAPPLPVEEDKLDRLRQMVTGRKLWVASSTHPGEEEMIAQAHDQLKKQSYDDLLTIIVPRHPHRGQEIAELLDARGSKIARRSADDAIEPDTDFYIGDTLGELGVFYRLSDIVLVGGSLAAKGGHNPLEPARLHAAILHGPHTYNFVETYAVMRRSGGSALVRNERDLAAALVRLFADDMTRRAMAEAATRCAEESAEKVLADIIDSLNPLLPQAQTGVHARA